jgi:hypothetical protein
MPVTRHQAKQTVRRPSETHHGERWLPGEEAPGEASELASPGTLITETTAVATSAPHTPDATCGLPPRRQTQ